MQDQVAGSTLYASSFDLSPSLGQGTTGSELPAKRVKSVADTPYTTPPLSPYVRKVEVIVSYDPEKLTSSPLSSTMKGFSTVTDMSDMTRTEPGTCVISPPKLDKYTDVRKLKARPLARFGGCLSMPDTVYQLTSALSPSGLLEPRSSFSARGPIVAQSITTVYVNSTIPSPAMGGSSDLASRTMSPPSRQRVGTRRETLACKQQPMSLTSSTQSYPLYSVDRIDQAYYSSTSFISKQEPSVFGSDNWKREKEKIEKEKEARRECFVYGTKLVDDHVWANMCSDATRLSHYTIVQELIASMDGPTIRKGETFLVITYHFVSVPTQLHSSLDISSSGGSMHTTTENRLNPCTHYSYSPSNLDSHSPRSSISSVHNYNDSPSPGFSLRNSPSYSYDNIDIMRSSNDMQLVNTGFSPRVSAVQITSTPADAATNTVCFPCSHCKFDRSSLTLPLT